MVKEDSLSERASNMRKAYKSLKSLKSKKFFNSTKGRPVTKTEAMNQTALKNHFNPSPSPDTKKWLTEGGSKKRKTQKKRKTSRRK